MPVHEEPILPTRRRFLQTAAASVGCTVAAKSSSAGPAAIDELTAMSASKIARMIRERKVSSVEVVEAHLKRMHEVQPALNAMVHISKTAIRDAKRADSVQGNQRADRPLHGVPITIKDNLEVAGMSTTSGTPIHRGIYQKQTPP